VSRIPTARLLSYAIGESASSITMNGIAAFALLYYTSVLGLGAGLAGLALSVPTFFDAVTDPVMGHITDNTRSRWGRRLPYVLVGGLLLAASFFCMWIMPVGTLPVWLLSKASLSLGLLISGGLIAVAGIVSGADTQSPESVHRIALITFIIGPILMGLSFFVLWGYPVNRESLRAMEQGAGTDRGSLRHGS
jgi:Na+/melibiose symporter-like transporter